MYLLRGSHSGRNAGMPGMQRRTREKITRIHPAHTSERRGGRRKNAICFITFYRNLQIYCSGGRNKNPPALAVGSVNLGDFTPGRYAWIMENPVLFKEPIPAKGMQGLWNYDGEIKELATMGSYIEILNLSEMLDEDGIQYEKERLYDGWHIGIPHIWPERERKYSIIEHILSYGHQHDLVELAKYDEDQGKLIYNIGNLTAKVAMEYIKGEIL